MSKEINSLLVINNYLTCCKIHDSNSEKSKSAQRYLTRRIMKILNKDEKKTKYSFWSYLLLPLFIFK